MKKINLTEFAYEERKLKDWIAELLDRIDKLERAQAQVAKHYWESSYVEGFKHGYQKALQYDEFGEEPTGSEGTDPE